MRKTMRALLAVLLCLAVIGGGPVTAYAAPAAGNAEAYALYQEMQRKVNAAQSMELDVNGIIRIQDGAETLSENFSANARYVQRGANPNDIDLEMKLSVMGESMTMYFTGGYVYMQMLGMKVKTAADPYEFLDVGSAADMDIPAGAIVSSSVEEVSGGKKVSFVLSESFANEIMKDAVDGLLASGDLSGMTTSFGSLNCEFVIGSDGYPVTMSLVCSTTVNHQGRKATMQYKLDAAYKDINSITAIQFPADLGNYIEM